jgi:hypothetical protein
MLDVSRGREPGATAESAKTLVQSRLTYQEFYQHWLWLQFVC